jgi:Mn-dependent DtxR family transcriptional regulator
MQLAARRGTARSAELARALGVSTALVEPMLEELARRGYLQPFAPGRARPCERCPARAACLYRSQVAVWVLSAKGQGLAREMAGQPPARSIPT